MEVITLLLNALPTVGFPILCCGLLGWFVFKIYKDTTKQNNENMEAVQARCKEREDKLYNQLDKQNEINGRFAEIIAQYDVKLEEIRDDVKVIKTDIIEIKANQN